MTRKQEKRCYIQVFSTAIHYNETFFAALESCYGDEHVFIRREGCLPRLAYLLSILSVILPTDFFLSVQTPNGGIKGMRHTVVYERYDAWI
ncbi:hypothetical protein AAH145_25085 [Bacteroides thetaiotaomicron]|uniref:hypothetical protein n=1 Tax=Bacteroidaceae TaxID=815 RepID=UPI0039B4014A